MKRKRPDDWYSYHSRDCGTKYRGCAPDCPKDTYERTKKWTGPAFPHVGEFRAIPSPNSPGAFGAVRKHDVHTGVDLYCDEGTEVVACEAGTVVAIVNFTGPDADPPSPWWNSTFAILIEGREHVLCYGEVDLRIRVGDAVVPGQVIGTVLRVLPKDKGHPTSMLHFEMYSPGTREPVVWDLGNPKPSSLLDPTNFILDLLGAP